MAIKHSAAALSCLHLFLGIEPSKQCLWESVLETVHKILILLLYAGSDVACGVEQLLHIETYCNILN